MGACVATTKGTNKCGKETTPGFKFCEEHKTRPKAIEERENKSVGNIVDATELFTDTQISLVKPDNEVAPRQIPKEQRNIYDKTNDALNKMIEHEERMGSLVATLSLEELRYQDKAGAEQLHSYMALHERAMDRVLRGVTAIAKLNIDAQSVNVNKMVRELIKACVTKALTRAGLDPQQIEHIRMLLAEEFEKASNETS